MCWLRNIPKHFILILIWVALLFFVQFLIGLIVWIRRFCTWFCGLFCLVFWEWMWFWWTMFCWIWLQLVRIFCVCEFVVFFFYVDDKNLVANFTVLKARKCPLHFSVARGVCFFFQKVELLFLFNFAFFLFHSKKHLIFANNQKRNIQQATTNTSNEKTNIHNTKTFEHFSHFNQSNTN